MVMMITENGPRIIHLFCPSLSTIVPFIASDDHRLDIGAIARIFGLDPWTVKLNGYFLSRGVDLLSCSVTWKSLVSFFSAKGLPTGKSDRDAIIVDGKLCKVGSRRAHDPQEIVEGNCCENDEEDRNDNGGKQAPKINLFKNKKLKFRDLGIMDFPASKCDPKGYKRKHYMEDVVLLKKLKIHETISDTGEGIANGNHPQTAYSRSCNSENMKRMREDEPLVSALCKRAR